MSYGEGAIAVRYRSDSPPLSLNERNSQMARKIIGFQSRKIAAFLAGLVSGVLIGGCSVFGPGLGVSVY